MNPEYIVAVERMQKYIVTRWREPITLDELGKQAGYSPFHAAHLFKQWVGQSPFEYLRCVRLTHAAKTLRDEGCTVLDTALSTGFNSHDGFTRAFTRQFAISPKRYREQTPAIPCFTYYPVRHSHLKNELREVEPMSSLSPVVTVTPMRRDARGLILLRAEKATDYFSFCEEKGCDWEGLLNSIPEKLDHSAFITLPQSLVKPGTCASAAGVEVPLHYNKPLPEGYEMISLVPCTLLYFQGMPFDEQAYCQAIDIVTEAVANYDFGRYGFTLNCENALYFNFGDARIAVTVNM